MTTAIRPLPAIAYALLISIVAAGQADAGESHQANAFGYDLQVYPHLLRYDFEDASRQEEGNMYGAGATAEMHWGDWFAAVEGWYSRGEVDFHAVAEDEHAAWDSTADDRVLEGSVTAGRSFQIKPASPRRRHGALSIAPYLGFGVRDLDNDIHGAAGYLKQRRYYYLPVGLRTTLAESDAYALSMDARFMWLLHGTEDARLSDFNPDLRDASTTLGGGDGYGVHLALNFKRRLASGFDVAVQPFFRMWDVEESAESTLYANGIPVGTGRDPAHTIKETGIALVVSFGN